MCIDWDLFTLVPNTTHRQLLMIDKSGMQLQAGMKHREILAIHRGREVGLAQLTNFLCIFRGRTCMFRAVEIKLIFHLPATLTTN